MHGMHIGNNDMRHMQAARHANLQKQRPQERRQTRMGRMELPGEAVRPLRQTLDGRGQLPGVGCNFTCLERGRRPLAGFKIASLATA